MAEVASSERTADDGTPQVRRAGGDGTGSWFFQARPVGEGAAGDFARRCREEGRVLEHDEHAVYGLGVARTIELPRGLGETSGARDALASLRAIRNPAAAPTRAGPAADAVPVALGAFAFDPRLSGRLVVPELCLVVTPHTAPVLIGVASGAALREHGWPYFFARAAHGAPVSDAVAPDSFSLRSVRPHEDFLARVRAALGAIATGSLDKVVLAREVLVEANRPFSQRLLLERLRQLHPSCFAFGLDGFVGASPELLCARRGETVLSRPLAGTVGRSGDPEQDTALAQGLMASHKEREEHRIVVDAIAAGLGGLGLTVTVEPLPHLLELRNVVHLATTIEARPGAGGEVPGALEIAAGLHPTPAVAGYPRAAAIEYLRAAEGLDRDRYAGPVGWMDAHGDGEWYLGIRSALVRGDEARLIAGVGIVPGSVPELELAETQLKLQALLAAAVRP